MKIKRTNLALLTLFLLILAVPLPAKCTVRSGKTNEPSSIDPAQVWDEISSFYIANIYDTLVSFDPLSLQIKPALALNWETSKDGLTWTFNLRRNVRFHNGEPFNAAAVVFTFFRQMDPANPRRFHEFPMFYEIFTYLKEVRKTGPYTVQFTLSEPFFPFLAALTVDCAAIVSPAAVKKYGTAFARNPIGTGAYKLSSWQKNKRLVLTANEKYWRGKPDIDEYIDVIEPQAELLDKQFMDGALDILSTYSISKMVGYKKFAWIQVIVVPYLSVIYIVPNATRPQLRQKGVRLALSHAWDSRALKLTFQELVLPIHSLLPRGLMEKKDEARPIDFSLAKARDLLKNENSGGEVQLELLLLKDEGLMFRLLSLYAKNLKQIGVKLKFTRLEPSDYIRRIASGDYDLAYSHWIADYPDPDSMLFPLLSEQLMKQGFANIAVSKRPDLMERLTSARRELNADRRRALYRAIDRTLVNDGLVIPLYQDMRVIMFNRKLGNVQPNPLGKLYLFDLKMK